MKTTKFSPKIEIINHFDNLINSVEIDIEHCLEECNKGKLLGELLKSSADDRKKFRDEKNYFNVKLRNKIESSKNNIWTESTKVIEYLNQERNQTIEELRKAQNDYLEYYKLNSSRFKSQLADKISIDELRSELYAEKFYFQVKLNQQTNKLWHFNLFTFVTDFYMSKSHIDSLEKLINAEKDPFCTTPPPVFDQKIVLIGLLYKSFIENLFNFPNHFIRVCQQDVLNIESIRFEYDFSGAELTSSSKFDLSRLIKLELVVSDELAIRRKSSEFNIKGLSSLVELHVAINSLETRFSIRNLLSLKCFNLIMPIIDENNTKELFDQLQNIEELRISGNFHYFNFDSLVNLKSIVINGYFCDGFNFELFKNLFNQLNELHIIIDNIDYEGLLKLLNGHTFLNLEILDIRQCNIKILEKKFIEQFPNLRIFRMRSCNLEIIENDAFSIAHQLYCLDLRENLFKRICSLDFSKLVNLEYFYVRKNRIESIENGTFSHMKNLKLIDICDNQLVIPNLDEFSRNLLK